MATESSLVKVLYFRIYNLNQRLDIAVTESERLKPARIVGVRRHVVRAESTKKLALLHESTPARVRPLSQPLVHDAHNLGLELAFRHTEPINWEILEAQRQRRRFLLYAIVAAGGVDE